MNAIAPEQHWPAESLSVDAYFADLGAGYSGLSRAEETTLAARSHSGDLEARNALVEANLRFAVAVAKEYQHRGLPLADLISHANMGLLIAVERFDERRGFKFISFAVWWIRVQIWQALATEVRTVRLPYNRIIQIQAAKKAETALYRLLGRTPTTKEIAAEAGLKPDDVALAMLQALPAVALDRERPEEDRPAMSRILASDEAGPDDEALVADDRARVERMLDRCTDRERHILMAYYGLDREKPLTLEQIGRTLGLTRERVRQIKERALAALGGKAPETRPMGRKRLYLEPHNPS